MGVHDLDAMVRTAELILLRPPNADWTINVIGLLNPRHPIFSKRYVAPKPVINLAVHAVEYDKGDEFFDDPFDDPPYDWRPETFYAPGDPERGNVTFADVGGSLSLYKSTSYNSP